MAYTEDKEPSGLSTLSSLDDTDTVIVGDTSDGNEVVKTITWSNLKTSITTLVEGLGSYFNVSSDTSDDITQGTTNYFLTSGEKTVIGNTSGTNTGDQDLSGYQLQLSEGAFVDGDKTKLDGIETGAKDDQTGAEIKALYEAEADTNAFTDADHSKLDGIEASATADQSDSEIETAYNNQVAQVSSGEKTAGTATGIRRFSPKDIADMAGDHGGGGGAPEGTAVLSTGELGGSKFLREDGDGTCSWQSIGGGGDMLSANNLSDVDNATTSRANLGVEIGVDVQAFSSVLDATTASFTTADETKLDGVETGATADQSDSEIETAYNNQVSQVSSGERTAGTETDIRRFSPADIASMAGTHGGGGGGDAWGDAVDADIVPDADGTRDLGSSSNRFAETHSDSVFVDTIQAAAAATQIDVENSSNEVVTRFGGSAGTVNYPYFAGAATGNAVSLLANGTDSNVSFNIIPKGSGEAQVGGEKIIDETDDASVSAMNTGTSTTEFATPDSVAGSYAGTKSIQVDIFGELATGDGQAKILMPSDLNGMDLVEIEAHVGTAGTTGTTDIQIRNATGAVDVLSTKLTIDSGETSSTTAATAAVINTANDDVDTSDVWYIDIDAVSTTAPEDLSVRLTFRLA